jgi:hypothetical protein
MIDPTVFQVARVVYEERISEHKLRPVYYRDNVFTVLIRAIKSAIKLNGPSEPAAKTAVKPVKKLAAR